MSLQTSVGRLSILQWRGADAPPLPAALVDPETPKASPSKTISAKCCATFTLRTSRSAWTKWS